MTFSSVRRKQLRKSWCRCPGSHCPGDSLAADRVRDEERHRPVVRQAVRHALDVAEPQRRVRLGALQGQGLAVLVNREVGGLPGGTVVEPGDAAGVRDDQRIGIALEGLRADSATRGTRRMKKCCTVLSPSPVRAVTRPARHCVASFASVHDTARSSWATSSSHRVAAADQSVRRRTARPVHRAECADGGARPSRG